MATPVAPIVKSGSERLIDFPDPSDLAFDKTELFNDGRNEPLFPAAVVAAFTAAPRLDPTRVDLSPETTPPKRSVWRGSIGSLLLHFLPLLALISGLRPPLQMPMPIPVQLVIEQPPPPLADPPPLAEPPPGPRASEDFGEVGPPSAGHGTDTAPPTQGESSPPTAEAQIGPTPSEPPVESPLAAPVMVPPVPVPPILGEPSSPAAQAQTAPTPPEPPVASPLVAPVRVPPLPMPPILGEPSSPAAQAQTAPTPPELSVTSPLVAAVTARPTPAKPAPPKQQMQERLPMLKGLELPLPLRPAPRQASASARYPGPNATRDEYCAYALHLTLEHIELLPLSLLGARRGDTSVTIRLREDGTVIYARVIQGSGYLDIDERIAEMVRAVGKFPPFPLWLRGPTSDFTLHMHFPNPAQR